MRVFLVIVLVTFLSVSLTAFETGRSSMKAGLLSAALPGAGQLYNQSYVKSAIFFATEATFVGMAIYHTDRIHYYYDKAQSNPAQYDYYQAKYQQNYNRRQSDYWWIGTTTFLSILDAYVDADLYNFDQRKKEIHLKYEDQKVSLEYRF